MSRLVGSGTGAIEVGALARWMDQRGLGSGPDTGLGNLGGGTQNVMLTFSRGDERYVLRAPPVAAWDHDDRIVRREARVLGALARTSVPHPRLLGAELSRVPLGTPFHLTEYVDGVSAVSAESEGSLPEPRGRLGHMVGDALAVLGAIEPASIGLGDFGRPAGFLERQVHRWRSQLEGYSAVAGYDPDDLPDVTEVCAWLERHQPADQVAGVVHGDMHLGNILFRRDRPGVAAFVDWELTTVGDPLLDLAQVMVTWPETDGRSALGDVASPSMPGLGTRAEILDRYARLTARDLSAIRWYLVLACFRLGAIIEGTRSRAAAGQASVATGDELHVAACRLLTSARALVEDEHVS